MLVLAKSTLAMMLGFVIAIILGFILIPLLKKLKIKQEINKFLDKNHQKKKGTPTMGGLIFILSTIFTIIILLLLNKLEFSLNLFLIMFVFLSYACIGFLDDFLIIKRKNYKGLTELQKLGLQLIVALVFFFLFMKSGHEPAINIHTLGIEINLGWLYIVFILLMLVGGSNSVNITDGLDGLAGGLSIMAFLALALMSWNSTWVEGSSDIAIFCFVLVGAILGFLVFNTHPAKIIMGDTGSLALGATMASVALLSNHELTFIVIAGIFIFETLTCIIQMISVRVRHKKVFLMAPFHHHLEKMGYSEQDIVKGFWIVGLLLSMSAIIFAVWI